jgi:hypothetical protein
VLDMKFVDEFLQSMFLSDRRRRYRRCGHGMDARARATSVPAQRVRVNLAMRLREKAV